MENRAAIVTGGGQGIGRAITRRLLETGYNVVVAEVDAEAGRETEDELRDFGQVAFIETDVSSEPSVAFMVDEAVNRFGRIDVLVNNAATMIRKPVTELSLQEWNKVIGVNLTGAFLCAKHTATHISLHHGSIINIASTRAFMSEADTESYSASKGGISALTHALAVSLGPGVRVNCIAPGWIEVSDWKKQQNRRVPEHSDLDRSQHPAGRVGNPFDIASMVLYLISDDNSFITGQTFVIDGGMTRKMIYV